MIQLIHFTHPLIWVLLLAFSACTSSGKSTDQQSIMNPSYRILGHLPFSSELPFQYDVLPVDPNTSFLDVGGPKFRIQRTGVYDIAVADGKVYAAISDEKAQHLGFVTFSDNTAEFSKGTLDQWRELLEKSGGSVPFLDEEVVPSNAGIFKEEVFASRGLANQVEITFGNKSLVLLVPQNYTPNLGITWVEAFDDESIYLRNALHLLKYSHDGKFISAEILDESVLKSFVAPLGWSHSQAFMNENGLPNFLCWGPTGIYLIKASVI